MENIITLVKNNKISETQLFLSENPQKINELFIPEKGKQYDFYNENFVEGNLLHVASAYGLLDMCKMLVDLGVDINKKNQYGKTPLATCFLGLSEEEHGRKVVSRHLNTLDYFLDLDCINIETRSNKGSNLLFELLEHVKVDEVDLETLMKTYDFDKSVRKIVDIKEVRMIFNKILSKGLDVNFINKNGWNALIFASMHRSHWAFEMLIASGADYSYKNGNIDIWYCFENENEIISYFKPQEKTEVKETVINLVEKMRCPYGKLYK